ncbi:MAG: hypothetical protein NVS4B12_16050 [Ktedonobacteraceae bacterium]
MTDTQVHYNQLGPGQSYSQQTYVSHPWRIKDQKNQVLGEMTALKDQQIVTISSPPGEIRH